MGMYTHVRAMEYYSEKMKYDYCDNIVDLETITLSEISQIEEVKNHMISLIGPDTKLEATKEQTGKTKSHRHRHSMW